MRRVRARSIASMVALAALVSACASGSNGDTTTIAAPTIAVTVPAVPTVPATPAVEVAEASAPPASDVDERADDKDVVTVAPGVVAGSGVSPEGVGSVTAVVTSADGNVCEVCLWLADDDTTRQRGLMGVTDLGDAVGMAFVWDQPRQGNFFMFQTPTPLSIAWFDDTGSHVGEANMDPCLVDSSARCERYTADSPYVIAVEMFGGQLDVIGIGPGASIELLDLPCA